jgi:E-phenylitaconyl-CoA hydratase
MAVRLTKELAVRSRDLSLGDGLRLYQEYSRLAFSSDDAHEGIASFAEKRDPTYQDG